MILKSMPKAEFLAKLDGRIRFNRDLVKTMFLSLDREERSWQPKRTAWSVDQCFQHLVLTFEALAPFTAEALEKPEAADSDGIFHHTWLARKTIGKRLDPKTKGSMLKKFDPPAAYSEDILNRFLAQQEQLLDMVARAAAADLQAKCWIIKGLPIRYNLGDYLNFFVSYDELHIDQAKRVLAAYQNWLANGMCVTAVPEFG